MPGLADIIGNAAQGAIDPTYGAQLHRQRFEAGQQSQRLGHEQKQELADRIAKQAEFYDGVGSPVGRQMHANAAKVLALPDDVNLPANLAKFETEHGGLVKQGETQLAQNHAGMGAGPIKPVASPSAPPNAMNSGVFSPFIGAGAKEAVPLPGALPAQNPLISPAPSVPGGPASGQAGFQSPPSGPAPAPAVQPVGPVAPASAPLGGALPNFQSAIDEFNSTGYMSPSIRAMTQGNAALTTGRQRLPYVQQIMDQLGPMTDQNGLPDMGKLMRAQAQLSALGIEGSNMAPLLMQMLQPQSEPGMQEWGTLSPDAKAFYASQHPDQDLSKIDPRTPVWQSVNKFTRRPVSVEIRSQPLNFGKYGPSGEVIPIETRTGNALAPVTGAEGTPGPINPSFVPITRNGIHYQWVDFGDHKELLPMPSSATSQRGGAPARAGGGALAPVPGVSAPKAPAGGPAPVAPVAPTGGNYRLKGLNPSKALDMKNAIEVGAHQLWGDPDNPALRPLASYASLADDPAARDRIGSALKLVLENGAGDAASHMGASIGPVNVSAGGVGEWFTNELGIPQKVAQQRAQILRDATAKLSPDELAYFNSLMNAIPTITGLRRLTGSGAFRWSQQGLERELPMIGLAGTNSSDAFRQKMIALGDEPLTAIKNIERTNPGAIDPRIVQMIHAGGGTTGASVPSVHGAAQGGYQINHKYGDLTYLGGDPNNRASWK